MTLRSITRLASTRTLTLLASTILFGIVCDPAMADCSRRRGMASNGRHEQNFVRIRLLELADTRIVDREGRSPDEVPCSGPGCSDRSGPERTPITPTFHVGDDWCLGNLPPGEPLQAIRELGLIEPFYIPILDSATPERPPRIG